MYGSIKEHVAQTIEDIRDQGLYKAERVIASPQDAHISVGTGQTVLNMCANNYLGLAEHPEVLAAAHAGLDRWGYGLSSAVVDSSAPVTVCRGIMKREAAVDHRESPRLGLDLHPGGGVADEQGGAGLRRPCPVWW